VLDLAADLSALQEASGIADRFQRFVTESGFSSVTCFKVPDPGEPFDRCIYMSTRSKEWVEHYSAKDYVRIDPLIRQLHDVTEPFRWSDVAGRRSKDPQVQRIHQERMEYGLRDGIVVPIHGAKGYSAAVSFASANECQLQNTTALAAASIIAHNRFVTLWRGKAFSSDPLTARERECLKWAAEGKSDWEIGKILNVSRKTINFHIERAKKKLGVRTRIQAVACVFHHNGPNLSI
jgi:DNA-binding CsgD family transcriptional regulator